MAIAKKEKIYTCDSCKYRFSNLDAMRSCSNCFACTGCEIYLCPECENEVIIKAKKSIKPGDQSS